MSNIIEKSNTSTSSDNKPDNPPTNDDSTKGKFTLKIDVPQISSLEVEGQINNLRGHYDITIKVQGNGGIKVVPILPATVTKVNMIYIKSTKYSNPCAHLYCKFGPAECVPDYHDSSYPTYPPQQTNPAYPPQQTNPAYPPQQTNPAYPPQQTNPAYPPQQTNPAYPPQQTNPAYPPQQTNPAYPPQQTNPAYPPQQTNPAYPPQQTNPAYPPQQTNPAYPPQQTNPAYPPQQTNPAYPPSMSSHNYQSKNVNEMGYQGSQSSSSLINMKLPTVDIDNSMVLIGSSLIQLIGHVNTLIFYNNLDEEVQIRIVVGYDI